jgi:hypothetical protein
VPSDRERPWTAMSVLDDTVGTALEQRLERKDQRMAGVDEGAEGRGSILEIDIGI